MSKQLTLAEYKAQVDAKYANVRKVQEQYQREQQELKRKDHWLLITPDGEIDGLMVKRHCGSAFQAFEEFFPNKKERWAKSAEGWRIEEDDADGSRWAADCERRRSAAEAGGSDA